MQLFPAIDILHNKVVRLARGDYDAVTVYDEDPVARALSFKQQGAEWIHIVDLEGARTGLPVHHGLIRDIISKTGLKVEVGGGVRTLETIEELARAGASRIVIGTKLITDPEFTSQAVASFGERICAGIDAKDGLVAIKGWREETQVTATELVENLRSWGIAHLVYTDIARDGMQTGIDVAAYRRIAQSAGFAVTASGGISTLDDLRALAELGSDIVEGAIVGRAIYEGNFTVSEAIESLKENDR